MGLEYDNLYRKYLLDSLLKSTPYDSTMTIEFYVALFFKHLYWDDSIDKEICIVDSVPAGPLTKVKYETLFSFRSVSASCYQLENFEFELLLQTVKPDIILALLNAMLLERKIVIIKDNIGDIAQIIQAIVRLLSPF